MEPTTETAHARFDLLAARESFAESRRIFDSACQVAARGPRTSVASAPLFKRSLHALLTLVVKLEDGSAAPLGFEETVRRAQDVSDARKICPYEFASRVLAIGSVSDRFFDLDAAISADELRRYEYDVDFLPDLYRDVWRFAVDTLTSPEGAARVRRRKRAVGVACAAIALLAVGVPTYRRLGKNGLRGSYYRDAEFHALAYRSRDDRIQFDWGRGSPRGLPTDFFSVRWEGRFAAPASGAYTFTLESDDGSRLFVDDALVIDNWGPHARLGVDGEVVLARGEHRIRVEYFDQELDAFVELSWRSPAFARRVMSGGDFR